MSDPSSSSSHLAYQPQPRQPRGSSAFSRLTNLAALSSSGSTTGSTSSSPAAASIPSSSLPPAAPGRGGALDALEAIAHVNEGRLRHSSVDTTGSGAAARPGGGRFGSSSTGGGRHWRTQRDSSESRSRERDEGRSRGEPALSITGATGGSDARAYADSPSNLSVRGGGANPYWGMEALPPNASLSAFSSFGTGGGSLGGQNDSHFFGSSAFSFEGTGAGSVFWDGSYRSSVSGSPSIFDNSRPSPLHRHASHENSPLNPRASSSGNGSSSAGSGSQAPNQPAVQLWDLPASGSSRSTAGSSAVRTSSPMGGGRKPKEASRALRFPVATVSRDKGLVGLAKPPKEAEQGRVAVAGKTCLKILKVPYGPSLGPSSVAPSVAPTPSSSYRSSSIAYRRSRSRGSPAPLDRARGADGFVGRGGGDGDGEKREEVSEVMDVRLGSRLGPAFLFSDVSWGFGGTSNKLASSFTNGAVVLWDLAKEGGSRLDQLKYEHDRAVNRVVFGGQTGNWLMSGGQDGQMKLWDIRDSRPANMILKAASPVRHLSFSPSASQPFALLAACASGTLIRYDVRYISRQNGGATDRIAGHIGACLAMDWRDGFSCERSSATGEGGVSVGVSQETAGGGREGGWVVTGGVDKTIKIWDFSQPTLSTKPVRTLYTSQAVHAVAWHPSRATELASSPLPSLGLSGGDGGVSTGGTDDMQPSTPVTPGEPLTGQLGKREERAEGRSTLGGNAWKNEIEVWDIRRPYFPKMAIKTEEPTSALLFNDDETIWATSKATATFLQHDVGSDSYALLDSIDRPAPSWNLGGDLAFVDDGRKVNDVPFERPTHEMPPANTPKYRPDLFLNTVCNIDPDFSTDSFAYLANNLKLTGKFAEVCQHNAQACLYAERPDASQVWMTLRAWFDSEPFFPPDTPSPSPPLGEIRDLPPATHSLGDWILSPNSGVDKNGTTRPSRSARPSSHRNSRRSSVEGTPTGHLHQSSSSSGVTQLDSHSHTFATNSSSKLPLDAFSEESTADETDPSEIPAQLELSTSSSSGSEHELVVRQRKLNSTRLAASLAALRPQSREGRKGRSRSSTNGSSQALAAEDDVDGAGPGGAALLGNFRRPSSSRAASRLRSSSRRPSHSSSSSSGSDLDDDAANDAGGEAEDEPKSTARPGAGRRSRSQKIASMHASLIANRSRRPSAGQGGGGSVERRAFRASEGSGQGGGGGGKGGSRVSSRQQSVDAASMSRRGSVPMIFGQGAMPRASRLNSSDLGVLGSERLGLMRRESVVPRTATSEGLYRQEGDKHVADAFEVVKKQVQATLREYADRGDAQLCATVCCVLRDMHLGMEPLWVARVTKTYLDLLRRLKLHVPAAQLNKYCTTESLRTLTQ
ncbi:hypothetical protein JCM8547_004952, partial [Rhodosporidiobolus lusitaniae]